MCLARLWLLAFSEDRLMDCPAGGDAELRAANPCFASVDGAPGPAPAAASEASLDDEYWRQEVAARLQRYRARRKPRAPRYPSLRLPFEAPDQRLPSSAFSTVSSTGVASTLAQKAREPLPEPRPQELRLAPTPVIVEEPGLFSNVIEFPRSAVVPLFHGCELAEPVLDRPRIVEAPEVLPPPPAMGGILIDPPLSANVARGSEPTALAAPLYRRVLAGALDCLVLSLAIAVFAAMFLWVNPARAPWPLLAAGALITWASFWAGYKFLFLTYTGSTIGMRLQHLRLARFDGAPAARSLRLWRVFACCLSAVSLGLGYLWSVLDEDGLCWHDRMTHTIILASSTDN